MVTKRTLIKNKHQFKLNIPIELVRKLHLNKGSPLLLYDVKTSKGNGFVVVEDKEKVVITDESQ